MSDLVERARRYATRAHKRIEYRRKYSDQPYDVYLEAVAKLVASVSDDPETLAAAWLHDTVEDTPATLGDIEAQFGAAVAELVEELTDVSRPGGGTWISLRCASRTSVKSNARIACAISRRTRSSPVMPVWST
jgi:(p)ppGpp synthase/HD superfamily hydrolase